MKAAVGKQHLGMWGYPDWWFFCFSGRGPETWVSWFFALAASSLAIPLSQLQDQATKAPHELVQFFLRSAKEGIR
jgi:hypothetical protein